MNYIILIVDVIFWNMIFIIMIFKKFDRIVKKYLIYL